MVYHTLGIATNTHTHTCDHSHIWRALSFFHRCIDDSHETLFSNNNNSTKSRGISLTGKQKLKEDGKCGTRLPDFSTPAHIHRTIH